MSSTLMMTPAAGWYHDPADEASWRWWDGETWTEHVRPKDVVEQPAVAVPAPVAEPAQPAQPAPPAQPTFLTPETPASEQLYWHSAQAEVVEIPGRKGTTADAVYRQGGEGHVSAHYARFWGDSGSPQTAGIWLLAALPLMSIGLQVVLGIVLGVIQGTTGVAISIPNLVFSVVLYVSAWVFAGLDIKALGQRGYDPPKIWWMLVPFAPLAYFIARGKVVRREGKRAWPPELLFFLSVLGIIGISIASVFYVMSLLNGGGLSGLGGLPV